MKRVAAILIVLLFAFQSAGVFLLFQVKQQEIRSEIKQRIKQGVPEEELVVLTFPNAVLKSSGDDFRWIHEREFIYHGQLYDIVKRVPGSDSTTFHCISDEEETLLFKNLDHMVNREMGKDKTRSGKTQTMLYLFLPEQSADMRLFSSHPVITICPYTFTSITCELRCDFPPPKLTGDFPRILTPPDLRIL